MFARSAVVVAAPGYRNCSTLLSPSHCGTHTLFLALSLSFPTCPRRPWLEAPEPCCSPCNPNPNPCGAAALFQPGKAQDLTPPVTQTTGRAHDLAPPSETLGQSARTHLVAQELGAGAEELRQQARQQALKARAVRGGHHVPRLGRAKVQVVDRVQVQVLGVPARGDDYEFVNLDSDYGAIVCGSVNSHGIACGSMDEGC